MFLLKKIVSPLFYPMPVGLGLLLVGLILLWVGRRQRAGRLLASLGFLFLAALSWGPVPDALVAPLEAKYPPLRSVQGLGDVRWVVVLGGGHTSDPALPATSQIDDSSLVRLVEGIRIHRMLPESRLVLSGGSVFDPVPNAEVMADVAWALGVGREAMVLERASRDTQDQALEVLKLVGRQRIVLVTSAMHMARSVELFRAVGIQLIPAPTGHLVKAEQGSNPGRRFPGPEGIRKVQRAVHEYLGMAWLKVQGMYRRVG